MRLNQIGTKLKVGVATIAGALFFLFFQNCSNGFQSIEHKSESSSAGLSSIDLLDESLLIEKINQGQISYSDLGLSLLDLNQISNRCETNSGSIVGKYLGYGSSGTIYVLASDLCAETAKPLIEIKLVTAQDSRSFTPSPTPIKLDSTLNRVIYLYRQSLADQTADGKLSVKATSNLSGESADIIADDQARDIDVQNIISNATIEGLKPRILKGLSSLTTREDDALVAGQFCVLAAGENLSYSWVKDGVDLGVTFNKPCLLIQSLQLSDKGSYTVNVKGLNNEIVSTTAMLNVNALIIPPKIVVGLSELLKVEGDSLLAGMFCVTVEGTSPLTYVWKASSGQTAKWNDNKRCYLVPILNQEDSDTYTVTVSNSAGSVSSTAKLTVTAKTPDTSVTLVKGLADLTVGENSNLVAGQFCVEVLATVDETVEYQWLKDGYTAPNNANKRCYIASGLSLADSGNYRVNITGLNSGIKLTSAANLTVQKNILEPSIDSPLVDKAVSEGTSLVAGNFCVTASGDNLVYAWKKDGVAVSGQAARCFLKSSLTVADTGSYQVTVSNAAGSVSSTAMLTVQKVITAPVITAQLANKTVSEGTSLVAGNFCVTASGDNLVYAWKKDGVAVSGQAARCFLKSSLTVADTGSYQVTVSNAAGSVSSTATLTVQKVITAPVITAQLANKTVSEGASLVAGNFCVTASGDNLVYAWKKDGVAVSGQAARCFLKSSLTVADTGSYQVTVSNAAGSVSSTATLTVQKVITAPVITAQLANKTVSEGTSLVAGNFCVTASGDNLVYAWKKDGVAVSGQAARCFLKSSLTVADTGSYQVTVSNAAGSVSSIATLTVQKMITAPVITAQLANKTVSEGTSLVAGNFCVTASGDNLVYAWKKDGVAVSGQSARCFLKSSLTVADTGSYQVTVSNAAGSVSSTAMLTVQYMVYTYSINEKVASPIYASLGGATEITMKGNFRMENSKLTGHAYTVWNNNPAKPGYAALEIRVPNLSATTRAPSEGVCGVRSDPARTGVIIDCSLFITAGNEGAKFCTINTPEFGSLSGYYCFEIDLKLLFSGKKGVVDNIGVSEGLHYVVRKSVSLPF